MTVEDLAHLHQALHAELVASIHAASGTPYDALLVAQRLFAECLAAFLATHAVPTEDLPRFVAAYGEDAAALACHHLRCDTPQRSP